MSENTAVADVGNVANTEVANLPEWQRLVSLDKINTSNQTQFRAKISTDMVGQLSVAYEGMKEDDITIPPVILYVTGDPEQLAEGELFEVGDGHQRIMGARMAGKKRINAIVRQGGLREAQLFALGCNAVHDQSGVRRQQDDIRKAVLFCLGDKELKTRTQRAIAELCKCSHTFVQNIVKELREKAEANGQTVDEPEVTTGRDGRKFKKKKKRVKLTRSGNEVYDWAALQTHLGPVIRLGDDLVAAYPDQKGSPEFHTFQRLAKELAKCVTAWQKKIAKTK